MDGFHDIRIECTKDGLEITFTVPDDLRERIDRIPESDQTKLRALFQQELCRRFRAFQDEMLERSIRGIVINETSSLDGGLLDFAPQLRREK